MIRCLAALALLLAAIPALAQTPPPPPTATPTPGKPVAVLQGLDKVTARVTRLTVPVGDGATFGSLTIQVDACIKRPPEEPPESSAFLRITDKPVQAATAQTAVPQPQDPFGALPERIIFSGWMFASSPALHPLEHPIYDVILLDCRVQ